MKQCPKCNSVTIDEGAIETLGYTSKGLSMVSNAISNIKATTYVCLECGYTETYLDNEKLKNKLSN